MSPVGTSGWFQMSREVLRQHADLGGLRRATWGDACGVMTTTAPVASRQRARNPDSPTRGHTAEVAE